MNRLVLTLGALALLAPAVLARQDKGGGAQKKSEQDKEKEKQEKEKERNNPAPVPGWNPELVPAFAEAKKSGKPLMVVFR
jgi:hypothetical protein